MGHRTWVLFCIWCFRKDPPHFVGHLSMYEFGGIIFTDKAPFLSLVGETTVTTSCWEVHSCMISETYLTLHAECFASSRTAFLKYITTVFVIKTLAGIRCNANGKANRFRAFTRFLIGPERYKVRFKTNLLDNLSLVNYLFTSDNVRNLQKLTKLRLSILLLKVTYYVINS